jgi:hypothetical protein
MARLPMGAIKEVLRLRFQNNLSYRAISRSTGVAKSTSLDYCSRFKFTKLTLSQAFELREDELEKKLFPERELSSKFKRPLPDFEYISKEIRKKGVTRFSNNLFIFDSISFLIINLEFTYHFNQLFHISSQ